MQQIFAYGREIIKLAEGHLSIEKDITFKELRNYLSKIDRLSICMLETLSYNNYICLKDVPHSYDDYYVYGIGMIESEFYKIGKCEYAASGDRKDLTLVNCIEVMLSEEPKSVLIKREEDEADIYGKKTYDRAVSAVSRK